jgi:hypothetical protein
MAKYVIDENTLKGIGDAIRAKKGTSDPIPVPSLASEISSIESGGSTNTYNGTIWKFRDNITFDEILAFADEYWQEEAEAREYYFSFCTPFTTDELLEDLDGEYHTQFSSIAMYGDSSYVMVEMYPVNGVATDLAYYDTDSGGEWKNHFTMTLDAEPSAEDLVFLQTFADMIGSSDKPDAPTYNGYIPTGTYTIDLSRTDLVAHLINKYEAGEDIPFFSYNEYTQGTFICVWAGFNTSPSIPLELVFRELDDDSIYFEERSGTVTIEITKEVPVEEGTFNAFMHNFTFVGATEPDTPDTPTYNGYIPLGKYVLTTEEIIEELWLEPEPYGSEDISCFKCSVGNLPICNYITIAHGTGVIAGWMNDGRSVSLSVGDTIEVIEQVEVDEETLNLFMHYFTPQE